MKKTFKRAVKAAVQAAGYDITTAISHSANLPEYPPDFSPADISILNRVRPFTMTSPERVYALIESVRYVTRQQIPGGIVECGVWRGGSMMAAALTLRDLKSFNRELYLFDTFEGMPKPAALDVDFTGKPAMPVFAAMQTGEDASSFCCASLAEVKTAVASVGYDEQRVHFVKGKVENTIPSQAPEQIAILRLDTDWYESTRHELEHLFPRVSAGGIVIIDDYGHWAGARKATDEYIARYAPSLFLNRIDATGRIALKSV
jgi:hypothetical protein